MAKIRWRRAGFEEIRRLPKVDGLLGEAVGATTARLTVGGYASGVEPGRTRSRGYVVTTDVEAIIDNARNQSLLRALSQVRI